MNERKGDIAKKLSGRVYTPDYIVKNILDLSGYYEKDILNKHVIDNSCGDGAFLTEIVNRYCNVAFKNNIDKKVVANSLATYIHGIEIEETECKKCIENLNAVTANFGINNVCWDINCADTLTVTKYNGKMDFVIGNPPYIRVHNLGKNFNRIKSFSFAQSGMTDLYIVFFEIGLKMLNSSGVLGYITPSSYFNSIAGEYMRKHFADHNLIEKIVDLKHFQAFNATTYTTITVLKRVKNNSRVQYYNFDENNLIPYFVDDLQVDDFYISNNFYFDRKEKLLLLKKIFNNFGHSNLSVKNGYATLCDDVFIADFKFRSRYIIPVIKASTGAVKKIFYPYDKLSNIIAESEISKDADMYSYLITNKEKLVKRSSEKNCNWYAFGRTQAISDTYKDKLAINALVRDIDDLKILRAPAGTGVYSGLYIVSDKINYQVITNALKDEDFISYVKLLGKYKSGGYYTFSSKDVKAYLDYKLAYDEGLLYDDE